MDCWPACFLLALVTSVTLEAEPAVEISLDITALRSEPPREIQALMREASALWRPSGVKLTWIQSPVSRALPRQALALDVVCDEDETPAAALDGLVRLGSTSFRDGDGVAEPTLRLSVRSVRRLVSDVRWTGHYVADWPPSIRQELIGRALGRVLAHEIGHFLFAWRRHTARGLMRAQFGATELLDPNRRMFTLPAELLPRLKGHLEQLTGHGTTLVAVD